MDQELIKVNINIAGRAYPVLVTPTEKLRIPGLEKQINADIQRLQKAYPQMDIQDCLSMAIIKLAFGNNKEEAPTILETALRIKEKLSEVEL